MKIPAYFSIIRKYIDRRQRSKLRLVNKGYKQLKSEDKLNLPLRLKDTLSKVKLNELHISKILIQQNGFDMELSIRQYLTERILGLSFNESILYSIGSSAPLRHPLPLEWRDAVIEQGVEVDNFKSDLLWRMYGFVHWVKGALYGLKSTLLLLKKNSKLGNYVYFFDLIDQCISNDTHRKNILNWYLQWNGRVEEIDSICHSVNGVSNGKLGKLEIVQTDGLPYIKGMNIFRYGVFVIYASIYSFILLFFKPINGLFLTEILKTRRVNCASDNDLAGDYLFHNSTPFYRPIWTYFAETGGARILFYFYSTNSENFQKGNKNPLDNPWHLISWPHYLVWDKFQMNFVKRFDKHKSIIEEVGAIWFSSCEGIIDIPLNSISVFDITPFRPTKYMLLGRDSEYYVSKIVNQFLEDVYLVLENNNIFMAHKMKRKNERAHKGYLQSIKKLKEQSNYIEINVNSDATTVVKHTKACISMPCTSTALIAKYEGKPSIYYDPSGTIQKNDKAAHGIPVLVNIDELRQWVEGIK